MNSSLSIWWRSSLHSLTFTHFSYFETKINLPLRWASKPWHACLDHHWFTAILLFLWILPTSLLAVALCMLIRLESCEIAPSVTFKTEYLTGRFLGIHIWQVWINFWAWWLVKKKIRVKKSHFSWKLHKSSSPIFISLPSKQKNKGIGSNKKKGTFLFVYLMEEWKRGSQQLRQHRMKTVRFWDRILRNGYDLMANLTCRDKTSYQVMRCMKVQINSGIFFF